jgi:hypothetical protein
MQSYLQGKNRFAKHWKKIRTQRLCLIHLIFERTLCSDLVLTMGAKVEKYAKISGAQMSVWFCCLAVPLASHSFPLAWAKILPRKGSSVFSFTVIDSPVQDRLTSHTKQLGYETFRTLNS